MKIQVFGSSCASCKKLHEQTLKAVKELGLKDQVEYITDVTKIIEMGVMQSPVLAIDSKPVIIGFVPDVEMIKKAITTTSKQKDCCGGNCDCGGKCQ